MVRPLRVMLGPWEEVGGVGPGYVAPGSVGDPHLRVMVNVGVGVWGVDTSTKRGVLLVWVGKFVALSPCQQNLHTGQSRSFMTDIHGERAERASGASELSNPGSRARGAREARGVFFWI